MIARISSVLLVTALLAGCASAPLTLTTQELESIKKIRLVCVVPQERLVAQSESFSTPYNQVYFGGVSASTNTDMNIAAEGAMNIVNAIRSAHAYRIAQNKITGLQKNIADLDYRKEFCNRAKSAATRPDGKTVMHMTIRQELLSETEEAEIANAMSEDALLTLNAVYSLQLPQHAVFEVVTSTRMALKRDPNTVWNLGRYVYLSESVNASQFGIPISSWSEDNARLYRTAVRQSIDETIGMLRADFMDPGAPENQAVGEIVHLNLRLSGKVLQKYAGNPHRQVFRAGRTWYSGPRLNADGGELEEIARAQKAATVRR